MNLDRAKHDAAYRAKNKEKKAAYNAAYRAANKEKVFACNAAWLAKNSEKVTVRHAVYYAANRDKFAAYRTANRAALRTASRVYYAANPDKFAAYSRTRRAKKRNAEGTHTIADIRRLLDSQSGKCVACRANIKSGYHVDHMTALTNGGRNDVHNLQLLCPNCNLQKQTKCPVEFMQGKGFLL